MESKTNLPLISIIMPAYNSEKLIEDSINSVISQTYPNWELIVINDGSSDSTADIVTRIAASDSRVKLFNQKNQGIGASRNNGYGYSSGSWIGFLDHDDLWHPLKLEKQMSAVSKDPGIDVVFSNGWFFYNNDLRNVTDYRTLNGTFKPEDLYLRQLEENYIATLAVIVKRDIIDRIGPWEEGKLIQGCDDYDYWFRMAIQKAVFHSVEDQLFYYRKHESNYSNNAVKMLTAEGYVLLKNYDTSILNSKDKVIKFEKKIHSVLLDLIRNGEVEQTENILVQLMVLIPSRYINAALKVFKLLGLKSYWIVRILFKSERNFKV